jgi:hypothetical protein
MQSSFKLALCVRLHFCRSLTVSAKWAETLTWNVHSIEISKLSLGIQSIAEACGEKSPSSWGMDTGIVWKARLSFLPIRSSWYFQCQRRVDGYQQRTPSSYWVPLEANKCFLSNVTGSKNLVSHWSFSSTNGVPSFGSYRRCTLLRRVFAFYFYLNSIQDILCNFSERPEKDAIYSRLLKRVHELASQSSGWLSRRGYLQTQIDIYST